MRKLSEHYPRRAALWLAVLAVGGVCGWAQDDLKKVSSAEAMAAVVTKVQPEYPAMARQLNVRGAAELEAIVAEDGTVERVNIVKGNPLLTKPAGDALKKWKFKPFLTGGKPVKALALITINFNL
jgi:protein TonB